MTRHDTFTYLLGESRCLAEQGNILRQELETLRRARFSIEACRAHSQKLRAFRALLANHAIALKWTVKITERTKTH